MAYRQAIDNDKKTSTLMRLAAMVILLIASIICGDAQAFGRWTPVNGLIDAGNQELDRAFRADSLLSDRLTVYLDHLRDMAGSGESGAATLQSVYWDAEMAYCRDVSAREVYGILNRAGDVDSVAYPYEWFRINYLKLKLMLYIEKDYPAAYRLSESLLAKARHHGMRREMATVTANQGLLFSIIGDYEEALRLQQIARRHFNGLGNAPDSIKNELNICNTLASLGKADETERRLRRIALDSTVYNHHRLYCNVLMSLFFFSHDEKYARKALDESMLTTDSVLRHKCLQNMTEIYYNEGDMERCIDIQKQVFNFFNHRRDPDMIVPLKGLVEIYGNRGQRDSALRYMQLLVAAQDTFNHVQSTAIISRMRARNEILGLKNRIALSETQAALERERSLMLGILCVVLLLLGIIVVIYLRRRSQVERTLKKLENDRLAVSLQNERLQNEQFQQAIDSQERELASKALLLLNKNELLNDLLDQIHGFALPPGQERSLVKKINEHLNGDRAWDDFTVHFEQVNPQFFKTLKERYPLLTDKDLKLCAYIKMGFSAKQIAQMLSVLPESVNTTRYRLRRKMSLSPDDGLEDHLRGI